VPQSSYPVPRLLSSIPDYMDSSTLYDETDLNSIGAAARMVEDLSFRAALSVDSITRAGGLQHRLPSRQSGTQN